MKFEIGGQAGLLFFIFLVLKLCDIISWSWWWIASPIWAPAILAIIFGCACLKITKSDEGPNPKD